MDCFNKAMKTVFTDINKDDLFFELPREEFCKALEVAKSFVKMGIAMKKTMESEYC